MTANVTTVPQDDSETPNEAPAQVASWSGVFAMSVCAFALIAGFIGVIAGFAHGDEFYLPGAAETV